MAEIKIMTLAAQQYYDEKIKKFIADEHVKLVNGEIKANADAIAAINHAETGILKQAKDYADGKDAAIKAAADAAAAAQNDVDALETYVGTIPATATATDIVGYVQEKTAGIATDTALEELTGRVAQNETDIENIVKDYLKAADKTELEGKITEVSTAVATEKSRAEGIEAGLESRLAAVEGDYLKAADKTELQGNIDTVSGAIERLTNGVSAEEIDGVNDLIQYVKDHGTEVTGMQKDISDNADAIAAEAERAAGVESGLDTRLQAVEAAVGDSGSVADAIDTAKQEAIDAAAADATSKANTAESNAKEHANGLNTAMNARVEALEAIDHDHANKAELDLIVAGDKAKWDAAEGNAKTYADGLNSAMDARVVALENWKSDFVEVTNAEIDAMFA